MLIPCSVCNKFEVIYELIIQNEGKKKQIKRFLCLKCLKKFDELLNAQAKGLEIEVINNFINFQVIIKNK